MSKGKSNKASKSKSKNVSTTVKLSRKEDQVPLKSTSDVVLVSDVNNMKDSLKVLETVCVNDTIKLRAAATKQLDAYRNLMVPLFQSAECLKQEENVRISKLNSDLLLSLFTDSDGNISTSRFVNFTLNTISMLGLFEDIIEEFLENSESFDKIMKNIEPLYEKTQSEIEKTTEVISPVDVKDASTYAAVEKNDCQSQTETVNLQECASDIKDILLQTKENQKDISQLARSFDDYRSETKRHIIQNSRQNNVMIFGCEDINDVSDILNKAKPNISSTVENIENISKDPKKLIIRVKLNSSLDVKNILKNARQLKDSPRFKKVFLTPDQTYEQRIRRRLLVKELRSKRTLEPEKRWTIKNGNIICADNGYT